MPAQHQEKPGLESRLTPRPEYEAPLYRGSGKLKDRVAIVTGGGVCQFVNVPGGDHGYRTQPNLPGDWKQRTYDMIEQFLREQGLLI